MTEINQPYTEPVASLMRLGDVRNQEWLDYLAMGLTGQDVPELCRMVLDDELYWADSETDEVWSAVHAWRALAQLAAESAVPALIERLGKTDTYDDDWAREELPVVFGHIGQAALAPLRDFLADSHRDEWARSRRRARPGRNRPTPPGVTGRMRGRVKPATGAVCQSGRQLQQLLDWRFN
jgi:hypothetical protein